MINVNLAEVMNNNMMAPITFVDVLSLQKKLALKKNKPT